MPKLQRYRMVPDVPSSRLSRVLQQVRSYWSGPLTINSPEIARLMGGTPVASGMTVNETTALSYSAVWSAVSLISSQLGNLPLVLYKKDGESKVKFERHPLYYILHDRPNSEMSSMVFRETLQAHVLTYGNAFAEIERDGADRPVALWPLTPDRVTPFRRNGVLLYRVSQPSGGEVVLDTNHTLHVQGLGFDGVTGYGVIDKMKESVGLGLAAERFGASFYGNGTTFGGVFEHPTRLTERARKNFIESINARHQGVDRAHKFMVVEEGMKYSRFGVDPDHAQFLETRTFQLDEVARWLNVPPHKLKNLLRSTNNNIEHQNIEYYIDCLSPWCNRWEQELEYKLIAVSERNIQKIEHVVDALLRGDSAGRGALHTARFGTASITPNEIRRIENQNPIPGGDTAFVQLGFIPLNLVQDYYKAEIEAKKAPKVAPAQPPPTDPNKQRELEQAIEERDLARKVAQQAEDAKDLANARLAEVAVEAQRVAGELDAERAAHGATSERFTAEAVRLGQDLGKAVGDLNVATERAAMIETDYQRVCTEKAALAGERDAAEQARDTSAKECDALTLKLKIAHDGLDSARDDLDLERSEVATRDAVVIELRAQIATLTENVSAGVADMVAVRVQLATAELQLAEMRTEFTVIGESTRAREEDNQALQRRLDGAGQAVRAVVAERVRWLVEREAERARRAQGSPEKLLKWVESFYQGHADLCREILKPSVRAWAVCTGQQADSLDAVIAEHIEQSTAALRTVAADHDVDTLAPALERVLRRWESDRVEAVTRHLCREAA